MKKTLATVCIVALPLLVGCSSNQVTNSPATSDAAAAAAGQTPGSSTPAEGKSAPSAGTSQSDASDSASGLTKAFGSTFTWDDGLAVTVAKPVAFTPSPYAASDSKFKKFVVMDVTVSNGTKKPYDAIAMTFDATTGDAQTDGVFDSEKGIDLPTAKVLPGKSLKFKIAYGIKPGADFVLTANSIDDFTRSDGIYSAKL